MAEEKHIVKVLVVEDVTHDVKRIVTEKPKDYDFKPGQATEVSINKEGWEDEARPFTFTSLRHDPCLEFVIKIYEDHDGVTEQIGKLQRGDELILRDVWGAIEYKGPGVFIAGGAGVTPFIAIFRMLENTNRLEGNQLIFSNKSKQDIILNGDFTRMLGDEFINTLTEKSTDNYDDQMIDKKYIREKVNNFSQNFYVCGPPKLVEDVSAHLKDLGAEPDGIVFEE